MIDIGMGAWVSDYDGYMLMKFTSKYEFQQDFLNGKLFLIQRIGSQIVKMRDVVILMKAIRS